VAGQLFLQYFDAVCWVFSPVKLSRITYTVLVETLNPAQSSPIFTAAGSAVWVRGITLVSVNQIESVYLNQ